MLPTELRQVLQAKGTLHTEQWNLILQVANDKTEQIVDRELCAKVLWERAETAKAHIQKQLDIYKTLYLELAHEGSEQRSKTQALGQLTEMLKNVDGEELAKIALALRMKGDKL